jgi:hypothetical protein
MLADKLIRSSHLYHDDWIWILCFVKQGVYIRDFVSAKLIIQIFMSGDVTTCSFFVFKCSSGYLLQVSFELVVFCR